MNIGFYIFFTGMALGFLGIMIASIGTFLGLVIFLGVSMFGALMLVHVSMFKMLSMFEMLRMLVH